MSEQLHHFHGDAEAVGRALRDVYHPQWLNLYGPSAPDRKRPDAQRVAAFRDLLVAFAPHWLEEALAFAEGEIDTYLDFQCRILHRSPQTLSEANCTAILALGKASDDGAPLLLKIRDEAPNPQVAFLRSISDKHTVLSGSNIGNLGIAQMANSAGLIGANNTGGPLKDQETRVGLNDCHILRLLGEQCATCEESVALLEQLASAGALGNGGDAKGMIFLLADASGTGVIAECSRRAVHYQTMKEGVHIRTNHFLLPAIYPESDSDRFTEAPLQSSFERYHRASVLATPLNASGLTADCLCAISRDQSGRYPLCQTGAQFPWRTVSAWVHQISKATPDHVRSLVCNVAPPLGHYQPVQLPISKSFIQYD